MKKRTMQMITGLMLMVVMLCLSLWLAPIGAKASAMALNNDECDVVFSENVKELAKENYAGVISISATKELLFDMDLEALGFLYLFSVNGEAGYAIVVRMNGAFEVAELYFNAADPYAGVNGGSRVYVGNMLYLSYADGDFYIMGEETPLSERQIEAVRSIAFYSDGGTITTSSETVNYVTKSETKYELAKRHPGITHISGYTNTCAPVAGANIIQYWDRYKTDLIANYTPGTTMGNFYIYKNPSSDTNAVLAQLYYDMETNVYGSGTTIAQFKSGLITYCARSNYSVTYDSCMVNNSFSYTTAKQYLAAGKPLSIFLYGFNVVDITPTTNTDTLSYWLSGAGHIMSAFGYNEITYTLADSTTRLDKYLMVAAGLTVIERGYLNVQSNLQIDDAYAITVS